MHGHSTTSTAQGRTCARWSGIAAFALLVAGCGDGGSAQPSGTGVDAGDERRSALRTLDDRDAFLAELRGALIAQRGGNDDGATDGLASGDQELDAGAPSPGAEGAGGGTDGAPSTPAPDVTDTNVQERGVDEQDRVKVSRDGTRLYVLHQAYDDAYPEPFARGEGVPDDTGADDSSIDPIVPVESSTMLRILGLDAASTEATPLRDLRLELGGAIAQGLYLHEGEAGDSVVLSASNEGYWGYWDDSVAFADQQSVLVRIDVDEPDSAAVSGRFRIDGQIVSSRRIGKHLFFASRHYPAVPGPGPHELTVGEWRAAVESADLDALLPRYTREGRDGNARSGALVEPERCFVAPRPENADWYAPDIVTLAVVDLDTMTLADSECYLGASETLYASPEAVYLATTRWDHGDTIAIDDIGVAEGGEPPGASVPFDPRIETDIHRFDIDGGTLAYRGSGSVRGHLGWNELRKPFRMSAREGVLRVATVNDTFGSEGSVSPIVLSVLEPDGNGALARIAELPNERRPAFIGKPGEQLYASRFVGDRAYLVTFRQTDPLYVVELADPRDPRVLGELEIEGYSDYLLPIDETHLLGIGRDAVVPPTGGGERGGFVQGVKLSLFDVTDPARPAELESLLVGQRGTASAALFDHRGITVQRADERHPVRVSFGIDVAGTPLPGSRPTPTEASNDHSWTHTALYGFDVHGGDGADIEQRGAMIVERAGGEGGSFGPRFADDRAVMVDDTVYYVHGPQVYVAPWDDLGNPVGPR